MTDDAFVLTEVTDGGIGWLTLNEPARLNPVNAERISEINDAAEALSSDDDVAVVVITGAGRGFCSGADLAAAVDPESTSDLGPASGSLLDTGPGLPGLWTLMAVRQPVIAMVNGAAVGYGAELALQADIRIGAESARIGFPFARLGIVSDTGAGTWLLPRLIGLSQAADLLYSARLVDASEAASLGLFNRVVPDDELRSFTSAYAADLAANSRWALRAMKRLLSEGLDHSKREHVLEQYFRFKEQGEDVDQMEYRGRFQRPAADEPPR